MNTTEHEQEDGTMANSNMKKDLQKVVKMFRDQLPDVRFRNPWTDAELTTRPEYPKAMMTAHQEMKRTATVNFGKRNGADANRKAFMVYPPFVAWCESYGIRERYMELGSDDVLQVRVNY